MSEQIKIWLVGNTGLRNLIESKKDSLCMLALPL